MAPPKKQLSDLRSDWREEMIRIGKEGGSEVEMRVALQLHEGVWYRLVAEEPEFKEMRDYAKDLCQVWWEKQGRDMTKGRDGNGSVWATNMKNRFKWSDKQEIDHRSADGSMTPSASADAVLAAIAKKHQE